MKRNAFSWIAGSLLCVALTASATTRYVNLNNPVPASPYTNWVTAATNIQAAVDAAVGGDEILVASGVYATGSRAVYGTMTNRVAIDKAVTVRSANGPLVTVIEGAAVAGTTNGNGAIRCVYVGANAVLSGFTLTNGHTRTDGDSDKEQSGGGAWCEPSGVVSNCALSGNSANYGGGASDGTLNNCTLSGNKASYNGGGAYFGILNNCTLSDNSAHYFGGGASYGTLNNCTLSGNSAHSGGGAYDGTLNNCALNRNSAYYFGGGAFYGTLNNCTLNGNSAYDSGGGASSGTLNNCTLSGNSASISGGGAYYGTLNNCTLSGNSASWDGGGADSGTLNNCIVYYNWAPNGPNYAGGAFNYSCTTPLPGGTGNFTNAPRFVNTNGWSDLRLQPNSPCIDAGTNLTELISNDLLGLPRPIDGNGDGIACFDIGAYEFNSYRFEPTLHLTGDGFWFTVRGEPGQSVRIERSPDLVHWEYAGEVPIPACGQTLIDPAATTEPHLFYRAMRVP